MVIIAIQGIPHGVTIHIPLFIFITFSFIFLVGFMFFNLYYYYKVWVTVIMHSILFYSVSVYSSVL